MYAVTVTQPVQSWTCVRSHDDFRALGEALSNSGGGVGAVAACPTLPTAPNGNIASDLHAIVQVRNELQAWLSSVLMNPSAHESPAVSNFLTAGANTIPPQYEGVVVDAVYQSDAASGAAPPPRAVRVLSLPLPTSTIRAATLEETTTCTIWKWTTCSLRTRITTRRRSPTDQDEDDQISSRPLRFGTNPPTKRLPRMTKWRLCSRRVRSK